jgi:hypothetical protein
MLTRKTFTAIALVLAIAGAAMPSFAQRSHHGGNSGRDAAIHYCSVKASKWSNEQWPTQQFAVYSDCMIKRGQQP